MPLALLLFLICALLSSVVLAASTAMSGRHSQLAETDQRYYSVVSAAQLLREDFDGKPVTVTLVQEKNVTTTTTYRADGTTVSGTPSETITDRQIRMACDGVTHSLALASGAVSIGDEGLSLPEVSALYCMMGKNESSASFDDLWGASLPRATSKTNAGTFEIAHSSVLAGVDEDALKVDVSEYLLADGGLSFWLQSQPDSRTEDHYSLTLECDAAIDTVESIHEDRGAPVTTAGAGGSYTRTETSKVTTTRETTITWAPTKLFKTGSDA